jgi:5'-deoxynucleotidase YfbR-like HD superfamily hydrolase
MSAWMHTATGRKLYFAAPVITPAHLFTEIAHGLARLNRFAGQSAIPISVAQHSVLMASEAFGTTGDFEFAAFCLLHDAHEAYFGDWPSPAVLAVVERLAVAGPEASPAATLVAEAGAARVRVKIGEVKAAIDQAVIEAAGLDYQRFVARADDVHAFDIQALRTERRDQMVNPSQPWWCDALPRLLPLRRARVKFWPHHDAEQRFIEQILKLCPAAASANPRAA